MRYVDVENDSRYVARARIHQMSSVPFVLSATKSQPDEVNIPYDFAVFQAQFAVPAKRFSFIGIFC